MDYFIPKTTIPQHRPGLVTHTMNALAGEMYGIIGTQAVGKHMQIQTDGAGSLK